jgi:ATP-binding cassette subfamily B protein
MLTEQGKTIILIAHRLSTVFKADNICVLDKGRVVEEGNHKELMAKEAEYFNLWQKQFPILNGHTISPLPGEDVGVG